MLCSAAVESVPAAVRNNGRGTGGTQSSVWTSGKSWASDVDYLQRTTAVWTSTAGVVSKGISCKVVTPKYKSPTRERECIKRKGMGNARSPVRTTNGLRLVWEPTLNSVSASRNSIKTRGRRARARETRGAREIWNRGNGRRIRVTAKREAITARNYPVDQTKKIISIRINHEQHVCTQSLAVDGSRR